MGRASVGVNVRWKPIVRTVLIDGAILLLVGVVTALFCYFNGLPATRDLFLKCKAENGSILAVGLPSLAVLAYSTYRRIKKRTQDTVFIPSYSGVAACFFVAPSGVCCVGYLLCAWDPGNPETAISDGLIICTTFAIWIAIIFGCHWYALRGRVARDRADVNEEHLSMVFFVLALVVVTIGIVNWGGLAWLGFPETHKPAAILVAGFGGLLSAIDTWWKVVWQQVDSEAVEVRGPVGRR